MNEQNICIPALTLPSPPPNAAPFTSLFWNCRNKKSKNNLRKNCKKSFDFVPLLFIFAPIFLLENVPEIRKKATVFL